MTLLANLPDLAFTTRHFEDLVGRRVTGILAPQRLKTGAADRWYGGWYALEDQRVVGLIGVDLPLASYLGAALSMVPAAQATALVKAGALDTTASENLYECLNVCSRFYHRSLERPVLLIGVAPHPARAGAPVLPAEAKRILAQPLQRVDYTLTVDGYGAGQLAVLIG